MDIDFTSNETMAAGIEAVLRSDPRVSQMRRHLLVMAGRAGDDVEAAKFQKGLEVAFEVVFALGMRNIVDEQVRVNKRSRK